MEKKYLFGIIALSLILLSMNVFSVALTSTAPTSGQVVYGTTTTNLEFTILDANSADTNAKPQTVSIYWSTTAGTLQNLIVLDSNVQDRSRITCTDYNFYTAKPCVYAWTVPDRATLPNGTYYIDYNFGDFNGTANAYNYRTSSSSGFTITQPIASDACGIMGILPLILAAILVIVILGAMTIGKMELNGSTIVMLVGVAIGTIICIIILSSILGGVCVANF